MWSSLSLIPRVPMEAMKKAAHFLCRIGALDRSDEVVLYTDRGIVKGKDLRRKPLEDRWDAEKVHGMDIDELHPNGPSSTDAA